MKIKKDFLKNTLLLIISLIFISLNAACNLTNSSANANGNAASNGQSNSATVNNNPKNENTPVNANVPEAKPVLTAIYDGRNETSPEVKASPAEEKLINDEFKRNETAIMQKVGLECDGETPADGVDIIGIASGAFTKPDAAQKAYLYERCRSGRAFGVGGLVIVENGKAIAHYAYGENGLDSGITAVPDVNKNGLSEIVLDGGDTGQGYTESIIEMFEFKAGNLQFLGRADTYSDNGGAVEDDSKALTTAYKISAESAAEPLFYRDTYEKKGKSKVWTPTKKAEKITLDKKDAPKFVKII